MSAEDSVAGTPTLTGDQLRDRYWDAVPGLTLGLVRRRGNSVALGPIDLLRFGTPVVTARSVEWPIEGGILAGAPGGLWSLAAADGGIVAQVDHFRPRLVRPLYAISHLQVHLLFTRLFLLSLRGRATPEGTVAAPGDRMRAAAVDVAFCLTAGRLFGLRMRPRAVLGLLAGYHIACWTVSGQTLGGVVMRQRVASLDGKRPTLGQSLLRFAASPLSWIMRRPVHDELARTAVIVAEKEEGAASAAP